MIRKPFRFISFLLFLIFSVGVLGACDGVTTEADRLKVYTVFFHDNYQGIHAKVVVEAGKTVSLPADPSRVGYDFEGWMLSSEEDAIDAFDESRPIDDNTTVYAKWTRDVTVSLVTFNFMNYRTADAIVVVAKGSVLPAPETPVYDENEMYAFVNWYTDFERTQVYDFDSAVNDDITLYAGWVQQKAYLTLDYNYTASPAPIVNAVNLGIAVSEIDAPIRNQYEFVGWYTERVGGLPFDFGAPIASDVTIYAHWSRNAYMVTFHTNSGLIDGGIELSYEILKNASIETQAEAIENAMSLVGHDFAGWYLIRINPNSEEPLPEEYRVDLTNINDDKVLYAAWTLHEYQVSFDYNYEGAPAAPDSQSVKYTKLSVSPSALDREGYLFGGWFTEPACVNQFTFGDTPVTADLTLYAKWIEEDIEQPDVVVRYVYDIGDGEVEHALLEVTFNGTVGDDAPEDPAIEDYIFVGWYRDAAYATKFSTSMNLVEDTTVFAKMLKKYTFEAEAVDLTDKYGQGTSTNSYEEGLIMDDSFVSGGDVSNGYFIRELYYYGAYIDFIIEAEADETDAVLYIRASSESYEFFGARSKVEGGPVYNYMSDTDFKIIVNGEWADGEPLTWLEYGGLYLPMANIEEREDLAQNKTPFEDLFVISGLDLHEGTNIITLFVANNNNHGGTFHAEAPIIDCIYLYSSVGLTMFDYQFYTRENVKRG